MSSKTLFAASAAVASILGAAGAANAATVGTFATITINGGVSGTAFGATVTGVITGSGTGAVLDDGGTLTFTDTQVAHTTVGGAASTPTTTTANGTFTGTYASSVFTPSAGTSITTSCQPSASTACGVLNSNKTVAFGSPTGTVTLGTGGSIVATIPELGGAVLATETITFSNPVSSVPLPPAVWLLGSGLLGLVGTARRRKA